MAVNSRNKTAETLAARLAQLTGGNETEAVTRALADCVQRARGQCSLADEIALHRAWLALRDARSDEAILGYDEHGLPRRWSSIARRS
jgi:antitoxin VapB